MTTLPLFERRRERRIGAEAPLATRLWSAALAGFADMGSLGLRKSHVRRPERSDADALAGDWRKTLSGLDRALKRAERNGQHGQR